MARKTKSKRTTYFDISWSNTALFETLNKLQGSVRREIISEATLKVAKKMGEDFKAAFQAVYSPDAYADIFVNQVRKHSKNKELKQKGMLVERSFNERDAVVSISSTYSDFRLHFFETGTVERKTSKGENRGRMLSHSERIGFFWPTFDTNGQQYAEMLSKEVTDILKKN